MTNALRAFVGAPGFAACVALTVASAIHAQTTTPPPAPPVSARGCLLQLADSPGAPPMDHERPSAKGLALTRATLQAREGGAPRGVEQSFWLVGAKAAELLRFVGRQVELTGTIDDRLIPNPGTRTPADVLARPAPPTRAIAVNTFRALEEACS